MSTALFDLAKLRRNVRTIDSERALRPFKDYPSDDLFSEIFERPRRRGTKSRYLRGKLLHHAGYCNLPVNKIAAYAENWFTLSQEIQMRADSLGKECGIPPEEMIAVNLRGPKNT